MKSRLLLLTGVVALTFAGPINAPAATIIIDDNGVTAPEAQTPRLFAATGFVAPPAVLQNVFETLPSNGVLTISGIYNAANPLGPGVSQTFNFNIPEPPALTCGGSVTCSDTLSITLTGRAADTGNMMALVDFRSGFPGNVTALPGGVVPPGTFVPPEGEFFAFSQLGLDVNVFSDVPVPGPIVGAGLPGLILGCGALLALARRRRQLVA